MLVSFFIRVASLTYPVLGFFFFFFFFLSAEFLLHISCWLHFCLGTFSYTSRAGFMFLWGVSLTHPVQVLKIIIKICGVSLTHPVLAFFSFFFIFFSFFFMWGASLVCSLLSRQPLKKRAGWKMAQKKNVKKSHSKQRRNPITPYTEQNKTKQEFLLHILCWLLCVGRFSYTSCAGFLMWGVSLCGDLLTHPVLASFCMEFLLHVLC